MEDLDAASRPPAMEDRGSSSSLDVEKGPDPASLEAAMQVPVTVMLGPTGPLLRKLGSLAASDLPSADEIRLLKVLCISLKEMSEDEGASFMVQWWMKIVRELCYDTDDLLEEVIDGGRAHHDFSALLARAKYAYERRNCFQWSPPPKVNKPAELGEALRLPAPICDRSSKVGVPEQLVQLLALDDEEKALKVIPIHGCAGVGKTTVARTLYHKHGGKFQCRAFITASTNPYMRGLLTSLLSQLKAPRPHGFADVPDLINAINKHLQGKRYFIVIDDLWTASVWNIVGRAFPRGDSCSRIITTTQIDDVALECCGYYPVYMYKMEPLNDYDESRKLFFGTVFGSEDACPTNIKEVSYEIIRKCGGLPLAIANVAKLLASESNIIFGKWKHIQDSLPSTFEGMKAVVNLMYNSLPPRLRTCLLYLSMFAQGYLIKKDELVKLWVAEDFLSPVGGQDTQEIAEGYFDELVSRGMVQAVDTDKNGKVFSCTVHQIVLDFIRHKSREENFVITVDYLQSGLALPDKVRRLSIQFGGVKGAYIPESIVTSHVRSLIFWGFFKCIPTIVGYGFLRVLVLHIWADQEKESFDLTGIGKLLLLKYLKIESNTTIELPDKIQGLRHLETLQVDARMSIVPSDIVSLPHMLHLSLPSDADMPRNIRRMTSLRTLGYLDLSNNRADNVMDLGYLTNLRDLHLTCAQLHTYNLENSIKHLGLNLGKLINLKNFTLAPADSSHINTLVNAGASRMGICWDGLQLKLWQREASRPWALQRLELSRYCCIFSRLPEWIGDTVNLCILKIAVVGLLREDIDVLKGLPSLGALTLYIQTAPNEGIFIDKGGFELLTYFKFMCGAPCLSFVPGAMPKVQRLSLGFNSNKMKPDSIKAACFHHLTGLAEVSVKVGVQDATEFDIKAAESALQSAVWDLPNTPIIRVQCAHVMSYTEEYKIQLQEIAGKKIYPFLGYGEKRKQIQEDRKKIMNRSEEQGGKRKKIQEDKKKITESSDSEEDKSGYVSEGSVFTKHHAPIVDLVTGAFGSLFPKLLDLLEVKHKLQTGVTNLVDSLYKDLEALQAALRGVAKMEQDRELEADQRDEVLNAWARDARDLSYDAEDTVDSSSVHVEGSDPDTKLKDGIESLIRRTSALLRRGKARHEISDAIDDIMGKAQDLAARRERYKVSVHIAANPNAAASFITPLSALYEYSKDSVGINVPRDDVISILIDETGLFKQLKTVSILGIGGLGKTTLAKAVYDKIQGLYDCTVFILVSRHLHSRNVLMEILFQIDKQNCRNLSLAKLDEPQLIDEIGRLLQNKRYLIVIDNICDLNLWETIKVALIDSGLGSRVVTTTRIHMVAKNGGEVYRLKPLNDEQSRELFRTRLFNGEKNVPRNLWEASAKILSKCDGVPLAIMTAASLLVRKSMNDYSKLYNNIHFGSEVEDNTRKILKFSYYDLPYHMRACLLHLHIFPEDCLIRKEALIWKWAAEGLIVEEPGKGLFELGEEYLKELINRNLVMPVEDDSHPGKVIGCRVHDLVFDMICSFSTQENFVTVLDGCKQQTPVGSKARRLSVQNWAAEAEQGDPLHNIHPERLRSFNTMRCLFSTELSFSRFELLRVLALEECTLFEGNLSHLGKLLLLRYLGLYNTPIEKLPEEIDDLIYLQTLDLRGTGIKKLPTRVARLRQLKCLRADKGTSVPYWMGNLTSLEDLRLGEVDWSENFVNELSKLTELRELEIGIGGLHQNKKKTLVQSLRKLEKIQVLRFIGSSPLGGELNWGHFDPPPKLHELHLSIAFSRLPAWINVFRVPMLSHFSVRVEAMEEQELENLGSLPNLISLELLLPSDFFPTIKGDGAFPELRCFHTSAPFIFSEGTMPKLELFHFKVHVPALKYAKVNFDDDVVASTLRNLTSLQKVRVEISSTGDVKAMHEALKRATEKHRNRPSLDVFKTDQEGTAHRRLL